MFLPSVLWSLCLACYASASVTVYSQAPLGATPTATASGGNYTGKAAYDPTILNAPAIPSPAPATQFSLQLYDAPNAVQGLSIPQSGSFLGFSIEMSIISQDIGTNSSLLQVTFLNLMQNIAQRGGQVHVRVGGNTQDYAFMVPSLADGKMIEKMATNNTNPTETPTLMFTPDVLYLLGNVSALVDVRWYLGVPLNDSSNLRMQIAEVGEQVLGDKLLGLQVGNEPDLYSAHGHRASSYGPYDYFGDFGNVVNAMNSDTLIPTKNNLIAPNLAGTWTPEEVWDTNFIPSYTNSLYGLAVEHYPSDNCFAEYGIGQAVDPQTVFPTYLTHNAGKTIIQPYLNSTNIAQAAGKPFLMFETNTASCGGFPGLSDSFGSALWGIDYALQMAYSNFSGALLHVSGQDVYYNPFTPPPTNESAYHGWTVAPLFYANLVVAEVFGTSNTSQIMDLQANNNNEFTPAYAIYESGTCARLALMNFITDPTGASSYTATFSVGGGTTGEANATPATVQVKYLTAPSVSEKFNVTWAGQTFGSTYYASDGRLQGDLDVQTVTCDTGANTCSVTVPAPGFALVYLTTEAYSESNPSTTQTFSTSLVTKAHNTVTVNASVLATSNGHSGSDRVTIGSTSQENVSGAGSLARPSMVALIALITGVMVLRRALSR